MRPRLKFPGVNITRAEVRAYAHEEKQVYEKTMKSAQETKDAAQAKEKALAIAGPRPLGKGRKRKALTLAQGQVRRLIFIQYFQSVLCPVQKPKVYATIAS